MSIFYVDIYNGNDANDGTSWATAWKTLTNGATAARIAAGDEIRISKSPDPVSIGDATWGVDKNVTLAAARTMHVFSGDDLWIVSPNVTTARSTSTNIYRFGTGVYYISALTAFTTGKAAYYTLPASLDLSNYQELSFWMRPGGTIQSGVLRICLCSDATGDTIVDTFLFPYSTGTHPRAFTLPKDGGGNLGSNINSIAVYYDIDPGALIIYLNNILATKTNDLNLTCLISKCGTATGGRAFGEGFFPIKYIDGTTVAIDNHITATESSRRFSNFVEETVESFIRYPYLSPMDETWGSIQNSGIEGALVYFKGGYEVGTNNQNGCTFISNQNSLTTGLFLNNKSYIHIENLSFTRCSIGISFAYMSRGQVVDTHNLVGNYSYGIQFGNVTFSQIICIANSNCNANAGSHFSGCARIDVNYLSGYFCNNSSNGGVLIEQCINMHFKDVEVNGSNLNVVFTNSYDILMKLNHTMGGASLIAWSGQLNRSTNIVLYDSHIGSDYGFTYINPFTMYDSTFIKMINVRTYNTSGVLRQIISQGILGHHAEATFNDGGVARPGDDYYWAIKINSIIFTTSNPYKFKVAEFAYVANKLVTITGWVRNANPDIQKIRMVVPANLFTGDSEVTVTAVETGSTIWEQLTLTFTPTQAGVSELYFDFGSLSSATSMYAFIGSIEITQAD